MTRFRRLLLAGCLVLACGCLSGGDRRDAASRRAWLDATGGAFDGALNEDGR